MIARTANPALVVCALLSLTACVDADEQPPPLEPQACAWDATLTAGSPGCIEACFSEHGLSFSLGVTEIGPNQSGFVVLTNVPPSPPRVITTPVSITEVTPITVHTFDVVAARGAGFGVSVTGVAQVTHEIFFSPISDALDPVLLEAERERPDGRFRLQGRGVEIMAPIMFGHDVVEWVFASESARNSASLVRDTLGLSLSRNAMVLDGLYGVIDTLDFYRWMEAVHDDFRSPPIGREMWFRVRRLASCGQSKDSFTGEKTFANWSNLASVVWAEPATSVDAFQATYCSMEDPPSGIEDQDSLDALCDFVATLPRFF